MAKPWKPTRGPEAPQTPTTVHEICQRYYACAVTLAKVMGVPLTETFMQAYHAAIAATFIETGRAGVRLPPGVTLPPLVSPNGHGALQPEASNRAMAEAVGVAHMTVNRDLDTGTHVPADPEREDETEVPALPTRIPSDGTLPCAGQEIATLKPAALAMLIAKVATLAHAEGAGWAPLLHALTREREARLAKGRRPRAVVPPPDGTA